MKNENDFIAQISVAVPLLTNGNDKEVLAEGVLSKVIDKHLDLAYQREHVGQGKFQYIWYIRNSDNNLYDLFDIDTLKTYIKMIADYFGRHFRDLTKLSFKVMVELCTAASIKENSKNKNKNKNNKFDAKKFAPHPSNYILAYNGIFDNKTKQFHVVGSKKYLELTEKYTFLNNPTFNYNASPVDKTKRDLYGTFMNDLSGGNPEIRLLLEQGLYSIIEGNGRHKYFMISGDPGIGKSTLGRIMEALANEENVKILNIDKLGRDNAINTISPQTRLIIGDDLKNNAYLNDDAITNYKTLVDGRAISVEVKYEPNRVIKTNATWVQMMNEPPRIYEDNEAITDRTIFIHLKGTNHRNETDKAAKEMAKRLDEYLGKENNDIINQEFIDEIASYLLDTIEPFDKFDIPEEIKQSTKNMVAENNWMRQFIEYATTVGLFEFNELKQTTIISCVNLYLRENHPGMTIPNSRNIIKEWKKSMKDAGYELTTKTVRKLNLMDFNPQIVSDLMFPYYADNQTPSPVYARTHKLVTDDKLKKFKKLIYSDIHVSPDDFTVSELTMLYVLIHTGDTVAASLKPATT